MRNSHCWGAKQFEDTLLTSVVSLISKRKVWRSSDSVRNIFISSGVPTWKQALEVRAFSSSISFWKCAIYKVKWKKVQPLKHGRAWNKCRSSWIMFLPHHKHLPLCSQTRKFFLNINRKEYSIFPAQQMKLKMTEQETLTVITKQADYLGKNFHSDSWTTDRHGQNIGELKRSVCVPIQWSYSL